MRMTMRGILASVMDAGLELLYCGNLGCLVRKAAKTGPPNVSIGNAVLALLKAKRASNKSPRYVKSLGGYLNQFMKGRSAELVGGIGVGELEEWFAGRDEMPATAASY